MLDYPVFHHEISRVFVMGNFRQQLQLQPTKPQPFPYASQDVMLARQVLMNCVPSPNKSLPPPGCDGGDPWMIHKYLLLG